ncbi:hypothetical protein PTTG_28772 [Puccinia triticina 1-1 BBBD Race 1]|uniref:Uncharacterized protein n=2 Tax=Puccinia triticina TaxID=208348 RepID=A0A180G965_PUCT1|nr:uncharacterized protein PtA15_17A414 [Puccinia triticina]OAV89227.1 hypothetical protein PTTG_28772 [Puccinia triticina 1-1 BBBD Race 1]WAQ92932.1 hypothetical protein PtA15_17A414 [Puccinia triticina]WAR63826.1 hypothetical protein PtB15_17B427 [Puccinia triticina]
MTGKDSSRTKPNDDKQPLFNISHILLGLTIGICLAVSINQLSLSDFGRWASYLIKPSSSAVLESSDDHLSWLSWHKVQLNNPLSKHDHHPSEYHHSEDHPNHQPPTLKEEIKKIINSNRLKLNNFNIIHSDDEL